MKQCKVIALMLLALVLLAAAPAPTPSTWEEPIEQVPTAAELQASLEDGGSTREVTLYYKDLMGYLVPVNCEIPWEEGIAKATLKQMVSSEENDLQAARLGLLTALPRGWRWTWTSSASWPRSRCPRRAWPARTRRRRTPWSAPSSAP